MEETKIQKFICYLFCDNFIAKKYRMKKMNDILEPIGLDKIKEFVDNSRNEKTTRTISEIKDENFNEIINYFEKVLRENFTEEDLHNFLYNREWFSVVIKKFYLRNIFPFKKIDGQYDVKKNKIYLLKGLIDESKYHELFHLCSTDTDSNNLSTGFSLDFDGYLIGNALNEGYTQVLTERYFEETIDNSYLYEKKMAISLEMIVGKKKMQSLYMNVNFFGLVEALEKYYTKEEIEKFLINMDIISEYDYKRFTSIDEMKKMEELIDENACFLFKGYCKLISNQNCDKEIIKNSLEYYLLNIDVSYNNKRTDISKINNVIEKILGSEYKLDLDILKTEEVCYNK